MATSGRKGFLRPRVSVKTHPKVLMSDSLAFFQQLSTLFQAGTAIYEALIISAGQSESDGMRDVILDLAAQVGAGTALNDAMASYPEHFITEWIEIVRSGELSGTLGEVLVQLTSQIDRAQVLRGKMVSAMIYPAIVCSVSVLVVVILMVKVVPTFAAMFASTGKALPGPTQLVMDISHFLTDNGLTIFVGLVVAAWGFRRYIKTPEGRENYQRTMIGLPLIGDLVVVSCMQSFANNLALLLRAGLPLNRAIESMVGIFDKNIVYQVALRDVQGSVERGGQLGDAAERTELFTTITVAKLKIGEESGTLPKVKDEVEVFYSRKLETVVERMSGSVETLVILFMGVTTAGILSAVYLPMFSMAGGVG